jgi:hypothetical protein
MLRPERKGWVKFVVGVRKQIVTAMDWTDLDDDDHATLCAYLVTNHGRATSTVWQTVQKSEPAGRRTEIEHVMVERWHRWLDPYKEPGFAMRPASDATLTT